MKFQQRDFEYRFKPLLSRSWSKWRVGHVSVQEPGRIIIDGRVFDGSWDLEIRQTLESQQGEPKP